MMKDSSIPVKSKKTTWKVVGIVSISFLFIMIISNIWLIWSGFRSLNLEDECIDYCIEDETVIGYDYDIVTNMCYCKNGLGHTTKMMNMLK